MLKTIILLVDHSRLLIFSLFQVIRQEKQNPTITLIHTVFSDLHVYDTVKTKCGPNQIGLTLTSYT